MDAASINAIASLISAVAWPLLVLLVLLIHRDAFDRILNNLEEFTLPGGSEAKLRKAVDREANAVIDNDPNAAKAITQQQISAAERVGKIARRGGENAARQQMLNLAREYEAVRASMPSSDERTHKMEMVVTKMRTLAVASQSFVSEFTRSESPGQRLAATVILQFKPSATYFTWIASRLKDDAPFIGYHAAVALLAAVRLSSRHDWAALHREITTAIAPFTVAKNESDRYQVLKEALDELERQMA